MANKAIKYGDGVKIHCPSCKEYIVAHANKCPYCHYDLTCEEYYQHSKWLSTAVKILVIFSGFIALLFKIDGINAIASLIIGIIIFLFGYFILLKVQSFLNDIY